MPHTFYPAPPVIPSTVTGYPEHYRTRYDLLDRGSTQPLVTADTVEDLAARAGSWITDCDDPVVAAQTVAPDDKPVTTPPWPGGTWGGRCGSSVWILGHHIPEGRIDVLKMMRGLDGVVTDAEALGMSEIGVDDGHTAAWFINDGIAARKGYDGFRASCPLRFRHDGPCRNGRYTWTFTTGLTDVTSFA